MPTVNDLKKEFRANNNPTGPHVDYCLEQKTFGDQAYAAAVARDGDGLKHSHQNRLPNELLKLMGNSLKADSKLLGKCKDFDEILQFVENHKITGFGQVAIYDTALRIGHCMGKLPQRVYLHAGTREGAEFFGIKHVNEHYILMEELPKDLRDLAPHDVEDFLCLYKTGQFRFDDGCGKPPKARKGNICPPEPKPRRKPIC